MRNVTPVSLIAVLVIASSCRKPQEGAILGGADSPIEVADGSGVHPNTHKGDSPAMLVTSRFAGDPVFVTSSDFAVGKPGCQVAYIGIDDHKPISVKGRHWQLLTARNDIISSDSSGGLLYLHFSDNHVMLDGATVLTHIGGRLEGATLSYNWWTALRPVKIGERQKFHVWYEPQAKCP